MINMMDGNNGNGNGATNNENENEVNQQQHTTQVQFAAANAVAGVAVQPNLLNAAPVGAGVAPVVAPNGMGIGLEFRLRRGEYLYDGLTSVLNYERAMRLEKEMKKRKINKTLRRRFKMLQEVKEKENLASGGNVGGMREEQGLIQQIAGMAAMSSKSSMRLLPSLMRLEKSMKIDTLKRHLRFKLHHQHSNHQQQHFHHQSPKTTLNSKISNLDPTLQPRAVILEHQFKKIQLRSKLVRRPSATALVGSKVLKDDAGTAVLICPSIKGKLAFFEKLGKEKETKDALPTTTEDSEKGENSDVAGCERKLLEGGYVLVSRTRSRSTSVSKGIQYGHNGDVSTTPRQMQPQSQIQTPRILSRSCSAASITPRASQATRCY
jgi:hypothetical protein